MTALLLKADSMKQERKSGHIWIHTFFMRKKTGVEYSALYKAQTDDKTSDKVDPLIQLLLMKMFGPREHCIDRITNTNTRKEQLT
jgi:hypothetical protein